MASLRGKLIIILAAALPLCGCHSGDTEGPRVVKKGDFQGSAYYTGPHETPNQPGFLVSEDGPPIPDPNYKPVKRGGGMTPGPGAAEAMRGVKPGTAAGAPGTQK